MPHALIRIAFCYVHASWLILLFASTSYAEADHALFRETVAPLLAERCVGCHNDDDLLGSISLESKESALAEVDGLRAIVPGEPDESPLLAAVAGPEPLMPQDDEPLSAEQVEALRRWIAAGAPWPDDARLEPVDRWWSRQPLITPAIPAIDPAMEHRIRSPVDRFVGRRLAEHGLSFAADADPRTIARRLYFDLIGLPPTPEQIAQFEGAIRRWQRAHPAESNDQLPLPVVEKLVDELLASPHYGERWARHWLDVVQYADTCGYDKDKLRRNAWPYRDYVIRSLNEDKPYQRFIEEQVAGDVLFPGEPDGILGLGFIAAGPWDFIGHAEVPETKIDGKIARHLDRDNMVANTLNTFCSTTIQCARCHDHKFDPYTQEHYYGLQAVFAAVDRAERPYDASAPTKVVYAAATEFPSNGTFHATGGTPRPVHVLHRGDIQKPGPVALPGALPLPHLPDCVFDLPATHAEGERRAALARWISHPENPLTWRSIVNRVWLYHYGRGLVNSPNDFGRMGRRPTHPELLDWLAVWFRDQGGSLKALHRLLVTSTTYLQSSAHHPEYAGIDGANQFYWRQNRRRLEAEEIRDAILAVSGRLDRTMGGPGYFLFELEKETHSPHYEYHKFDPNDPATHRRTIYRFVVRSQPDPYMTTLDCADSSQSTPKRDETLTALQALSLLNNRFQLTMAQHLATRVASEPASPTVRAGRAFTLAVGREPTADEQTQLGAYAEQYGMDNLCRAIFNLSEFIYLD